MRIFGRPISAWWLLLLLPLGVIGLPALGILFFAANTIAGAIVGPPAIWDRPWHRPSAGALVGRHSESERHWSEMASASAALELRTDGSALASNLPSDAELKTCVVSGELELAGHSQPYSLYLVIGDPDSGTGIWFKKRR